MGGIAQLGKTARDHKVNESQAGESGVIIALMGTTRAGKSTFIDTFTQRNELCQSHGAEQDRQRTREIQAAKDFRLENGMKVMFVEMPGFQDHPPSDMVILKLIADYLDASYDCYKVAGFIYLHDVNNPVDDRCTYNIEVMANIVGKSHHNRVRLVLNKYTTPDPAVETPFTNIWKRLKIRRELIKYPAAYPVHPPREISAAIVADLLQYGPPVNIALQEERKKKLHLRKTKAGATVSAQSKRNVKAAQVEVKRLNKESKKLERAVDRGQRTNAELVEVSRRLEEAKTNLARFEKELDVWK